MADKDRYHVLIASYLEPEHVERIRQVDTRLHVIYEPDLLRPPRYSADHKGQPIERTAEQESRWRRHLETADILFDFDVTHHEDLPSLAPNLQWVQATSSGIGQFVKNCGYDKSLPKTLFTTARGVHAQPLAEFCLLSMLMWSKKLLHVQNEQKLKHWERFALTDLAGRTLGVVGVGAVGREVARAARAMRMHVIGVDQQVEGVEPTSLHVDELHPPAGLHQVLKRLEFLVLVTPHTPETEKMIGKKELALLPKGAVLINIGRGAVVDQKALIEALTSGHLGGAFLDVFEEEPLPPTSPLWEMPNVLVSPHSASTSDRENGRITDLFCENLRRFLAGEELLNRLDTEKLY
jgi:phosphoglycerate dehydrogenase-like enzyme